MTAGTGAGVNASGSATIKNSTVTAGGTSAAVSLSTAQASTVIDSKLTGIPALLDLGPGTVTAQRLTLTSSTTAGAGVLVQATANNATLALDNSLIKTATGATALRSTSGGVVAHTATITARQITAVADATAASPLWAHSDLGPATISVFDSIASGYVQGVKLEGGASPANIDLHHTALPSPNTPATLNGTAVLRPHRRRVRHRSSPGDVRQPGRKRLPPRARARRSSTRMRPRSPPASRRPICSAIRASSPASATSARSSTRPRPWPPTSPPRAAWASRSRSRPSGPATAGR